MNSKLLNVIRQDCLYMTTSGVSVEKTKEAQLKTFYFFYYFSDQINICPPSSESRPYLDQEVKIRWKSHYLKLVCESVRTIN